MSKRQPIESRSVGMAVSEVRAIEVPEASMPRIRGHAAVYNQQTNILDYFTEEMAVGCFDRAIAERDDVRFTINHNPDLVLGRTTAGNLTLSTDERGLAVDLDPPDSPMGRSYLEALRRGDITGMSVRMYVTRDEWRKPNRSQGGTLPHRIIREVVLEDVCLATYPAYDQTEAAIRVLAEGRTRLAAHVPSRSLNLLRRRLELARLA